MAAPDRGVGRDMPTPLVATPLDVRVVIVTAWLGADATPARACRGIAAPSFNLWGALESLNKHE